MFVLSPICCLLLFSFSSLVNSYSKACENDVGVFTNEKGNFTLRWCYPSNSSTSEIQLTFSSSSGFQYIAIGFGGSMYDADIISGWIDSNGEAVVGDYYSSEEGEPKLDESLGGTDDVVIVGGSRNDYGTTLTVIRKLITGDTAYDKDISLTEPNDMIYAWGSALDKSGLSYHGDNHNHIFVDFSKQNGIPDTVFGREESGQMSREMVKNAYYGTLSTMQTQAAGSSSIFNYPFGSVTDLADDGFGQPILLLSNLERSVINLKSFPNCSMSINTLPNSTFQLEHPELCDVMTLPRTTLFGHLEVVSQENKPAASDIYLAKHPKAKAWISFSDFTLYTFIVDDVYAVGGFGNDHYIGFVGPAQYLSVEL